MQPLKPINIHHQLIKERNKTINEQEVLGWVYSVLNIKGEEEMSILNRLTNSPIERSLNNFDIDKVETDAIFHVTQIQKICSDYRLRFLDTKYFKGNYPSEVLEKISALEKDHNTTLDGFKIIAPSKLFRLDKADDPLLFAPMGNGYFYLIHKWGTDLHPMRKVKYWAVKNVENMGISIFAASLVLTILTIQFFSADTFHMGYNVVLFLFYFKGILGMIFFYGAASGKNFSEYCWASKYDKIT